MTRSMSMMILFQCQEAEKGEGEPTSKNVRSSFLACNLVVSGLHVGKIIILVIVIPTIQELKAYELVSKAKGIDKRLGRVNLLLS